ncbi:MAG: hypothetical protein ACLT76_00475 [Clostridium fessum]
MTRWCWCLASVCASEAAAAETLSLHSLHGSGTWFQTEWRQRSSSGHQLGDEFFYVPGHGADGGRAWSVRGIFPVAVL